MTEPILNLVVICAADLERSAAFYRLLGLSFARHRHGAGPEHFASEGGPVVFEIYPRGDGASTSATRLGFQVPSLETTVTALRAAGAPVVTPPAHTEWGYRAVVLDPDGHKVELLELAAYSG